MHLLFQAYFVFLLVSTFREVIAPLFSKTDAQLEKSPILPRLDSLSPSNPSLQKINDYLRSKYLSFASPIVDNAPVCIIEHVKNNHPDANLKCTDLCQKISKAVEKAHETYSDHIYVRLLNSSCRGFLSGVCVQYNLGFSVVTCLCKGVDRSVFAFRCKIEMPTVLWASNSNIFLINRYRDLMRWYTSQPKKNNPGSLSKSLSRKHSKMQGLENMMKDFLQNEKTDQSGSETD